MEELGRELALSSPSDGNATDISSLSPPSELPELNLDIPPDLPDEGGSSMVLPEALEDDVVGDIELVVRSPGRELDNSEIRLDSDFEGDSEEEVEAIIGQRQEEPVVRRSVPKKEPKKLKMFDYFWLRVGMEELHPHYATVVIICCFFFFCAFLARLVFLSPTVHCNDGGCPDYYPLQPMPLWISLVLLIIVIVFNGPFMMVGTAIVRMPGSLMSHPRFYKGVMFFSGLLMLLTIMMAAAPLTSTGYVIPMYAHKPYTVEVTPVNASVSTIDADVSFSGIWSNDITGLHNRRVMLIIYESMCYEKNLRGLSPTAHVHYADVGSVERYISSNQTVNAQVVLNVDYCYFFVITPTLEPSGYGLPLLNPEWTPYEKYGSVSTSWGTTYEGAYVDIRAYKLCEWKGTYCRKLIH